MTGSTGSSSDSGSETTGPPSNCLLEEFDTPPELPIWFSFSDNVPPPVVIAGQLVLAVESDDGPAFAGIRTNTPADFRLGSARAVLTEVPSLSVATTGFSLNDDVFGTINGRTFGVRDGMIRLEGISSEGVGGSTLLASVAIGPEQLPLELAFVLEGDGGDLTFFITSNGVQEQFYTEPAPDWLDDAYVSLDAGNPSTDPTNGVTRFELVELCADGLR